MFILCVLYEHAFNLKLPKAFSTIRIGAEPKFGYALSTKCKILILNKNVASFSQTIAKLTPGSCRSDWGLQ
jgi:hypothetical protein